MFVKPAALILPAIVTASAAEPRAVKLMVLAASSASVAFKDSLIVNVFAPALTVPVVISLDVIIAYQ